MRQDCRHFESRTYANGETVRKCNKDLAPDAPWRCPDGCQGFEVRIDVGWTYGSMVRPATPDEPPGLAVLDEAEVFLISIGSLVRAVVAAEQQAGRRRGLLDRLRRRRDRP